jgi:hypothetical protein
LFIPKKFRKRAGNFTGDLDSSLEIHRQVQDIVRYDDRALFARALLMEQTDHIATPAHMK